MAKQSLTNNDFLIRAKSIFGDKYDYSLTEYKNKRIKIKIICKEHGVFEQLPLHHLNGNECRKCYNKQLLLTTKEFASISSKIHNNKYDYSNVEYINNKTKIKIICPKHGMFEQSPRHHLSGSGYKKCYSSKGEEKIRLFLEANKIKYESQKTFDECISERKLPFDFYLPKQNILIEYDGKQHFEESSIWNKSKNKYEKTIKHDLIKNKFAKTNKITLIRIPYTKFNKIEELLNGYLLSYSNT